MLTFYYPSYGNPDFDGKYRSWNQEIVDDDKNRNYSGGEEIGADFYPQLGCYSSNDPDIVDIHMEWIKEAGIDLVAVSWRGASSFEDKTIPLILEKAQLYDLKVCFVLEPSDETTVISTRDAIRYIIKKYGGEKAFYLNEKKLSLFFLNGVNKVKSNEWSALFKVDGERSVRGGSFDCTVIGLWEKPNDSIKIIESGFDGAYSHTTSIHNTGLMLAWAVANDNLFVPSVRPGYSDERIRPSNSRKIIDRKKGGYYNLQFLELLSSPPPYIAISSFNNWSEGTQIEPAIPTRSNSFKYNDYLPQEPDCYLKQTAHWSRKLKNRFSKTTSNRSQNKKQSIMHLGRMAKLSYLSPSSSQYIAGGKRALIDGVVGSNSYNKDQWQGFEGTNLDIELDFGKVREISKITIRFLTDSTILSFAPVDLFIETSTAGETYQLYYLGPVEAKSNLVATASISKSRKARYIHVVAKNIMVCPVGHKGEGQPAWLFVDEIIIE